MKTFAQKLDFTILTAGEMIEDHGEDNYYSVISENCAIAAVFDGCGGTGSRKYSRYANHTGAYMASRAASGALRDCVYESESAQDAAGSARGGEAAARIKSYMERALAVVGRHAGPTSRIFGTMVRDFTSTAAIAVDRFGQNVLLFQNEWSIRWALENNKGLVLRDTGTEQGKRDSYDSY